MTTAAAAGRPTEHTSTADGETAPRLKHTLLAAAGAAVLGAAWLLSPLEPSWLRVGALGLVVLASLEDLRSRRIPNPLVAASLVLALFGAEHPGSAAAAALIAPLPLLAFALAAPGSIGMGDVKLMATAGALAGLGGVLDLLVLMALLGGLLGIATLVRSGRRGTLAYGPAIAGAAALIVLLEA